jgi:hypothetical protein
VSNRVLQTRNRDAGEESKDRPDQADTFLCGRLGIIHAGFSERTVSIFG